MNPEFSIEVYKISGAKIPKQLGLVNTNPKVCFSVLHSAFLRSLLLIWLAKIRKNSLEKRKNIQKTMISV